jgi:hypothetical protein
MDVISRTFHCTTFTDINAATLSRTIETMPVGNPARPAPASPPPLDDGSSVKGEQADPAELHQLRWKRFTTERLPASTVGAGHCR